MFLFSRAGRLAVLTLALASVTFTASSAAAERVEQPSLRSATSNTYRIAPDRFLTRVYPGPVNFRDGSGAWRRIDEGLVPSQRDGYSLRTAATPYELDLPRTLAAGPVRFAAGRDWVAFELVAAGGRAASARGAAARYAGVLPGVDVRYDARATGVKETLVLHPRARRDGYRFRITTSLGLEPRVADDGRVDFVRPDRSVAFHSASPFMEDAEGAVSRAVSVRLRPGLDGWTMTLRPDARWLGARDRAWPVRLDPTIQVPPLAECAYIKSGTTADICDGLDFVADGGAGGGNNVRRPLMRFSVSAVPFASVVTSSTLRLYHQDSTGSVSLHQVTKPWDMDATWFTYDGVNNWTSAGGDFVSPAAVTANTVFGWMSMDVTALTQLWVDGLQANHGLIMLAPAGEDHSFGTSRHSGQAPYLDVTYVTEAIAPTMTEPEHTPALADVWVDAQARTAKGTATDVGVGLQRMMLNRPTPSGVVTDTQYFKCDATLSPTCNPANETMCGGTWDSRCPITGSKTFNYNTSTLSEGLVRPSLVARDAAANNSSPKDWQLKVDHTPPVVDEVSGSLWDRRNQATDHRYEGLYDPSYSVRFRAHDGTTAAPRSGMKLMRFEVVDSSNGVVQSQTRNGSCTSSGCAFPMDETFTFSADSVPDGDYTIRLTAEDQLTPQANHSATRTWAVTVDRRGDVVRSELYTADPATPNGYRLAEEAIQLNTLHGRHADFETLSTRDTVGCSAGSCGETRYRTLRQLQDPNAGDDYARERGTSANDARLDLVTDTQEIMADAVGTPTSTGPLGDVLQPWQMPPPRTAVTYRYYRTAHANHTEDGQQLVEELWVDGATSLPLRKRVSLGTAVESDVLFTYLRPLLERSQLPANFFSLSPPTIFDERSEQDFATDPPPAEQPRSRAARASQQQEHARATSYRTSHGLNADPALVEFSLTAPSYAEGNNRYGVPLSAAELALLDAGLAVQRGMDGYVTAAAAEVGFAGVWMHPTDLRRVVFAFTTLNAARDTRLRQLVEARGGTAEFTTTLRTSAELEVVRNRVEADVAALETELGIDIGLVDAVEDGNVVEVGVATPNPVLEAQFQLRYGPAVRLVADGPATHRMAHRPLPAGSAIFRGSAACTAAFSVTKTRTVNGKRERFYRALTGGHCGRKTSLWRYDMTPGDDAGRRRLGRMDARSFPRIDSARVKMPDSFRSYRVHIRLGVYGVIANVATSNSLKRRVEVCNAGFVTVYEVYERAVCSRVDRVDYCDELDGDRTCSLWDAEMPAQPGDSGGPIVSPPNGRTAQGLMVGGHSTGRGLSQFHSVGAAKAAVGDPAVITTNNTG